jgi:hypothetical protein
MELEIGLVTELLQGSPDEAVSSSSEAAMGELDEDVRPPPPPSLLLELFVPLIAHTLTSYTVEHFRHTVVAL